MTNLKIYITKPGRPGVLPEALTQKLPDAKTLELLHSEAQQLLNAGTLIYTRQLTGFFCKVSTDTRLQPSHISVYMSLFHHWAMGHFINPFTVSRAQTRGISKTKAKLTHLTALRELDAFGYIVYKPSCRPSASIEVELISFEHLLSQHQVSNLMPLHEKSRLEQMISKELSEYSSSNNSPAKPHINTQKLQDQHTANAPGQHIHTIPALHEVIQYFSHLDTPVAEAYKFFNYYSANGWLINGWAPVADWQAAVRDWILSME